MARTNQYSSGYTSYGAYGGGPARTGGYYAGYGSNPFFPPQPAQLPAMPTYSPGAASGQYRTIAGLQREAQSAANVARIPGAAGLEQQSSNVIGQQLAGQVPQDVLNILAQQAAERGVSTGLAGAPASNAAYLRALGLTSLGQIQAGQEALTAALGRNPPAPIPEASQQFISPLQQQQLALQRAQLEQQQEELNLQRWQAMQSQWNTLAKQGPKYLEYSSRNPAAPWTDYRYYQKAY